VYFTPFGFKYDVKDLLKVCDLHLSHALKKDNAEEFMEFANRYGLHRAQVQVREIQKSGVPTMNNNTSTMLHTNSKSSL